MCVYIRIYNFLLSNGKRRCFLVIWARFQLFKHALSLADEFPSQPPRVWNQNSTLFRLTEEQSARTFLRFGPPFILFFFSLTTRGARTADKTNEERILKGSRDSHQVPAQPQMYIRGCRFGSRCTSPRFNPFFFSPTEETSLLHHIWSARWQPRALFTAHFRSVTNNNAWKPLS